VTLPAELSERHRVAAQRFTEIVGQVSDWDAPTSVAAWRARDVVGHLTSWLPGMLAGTVELPPAASDEHPADAWRAQTDAVQALLDDPATAGVMYRSSTMGDVPVTQVLGQCYVPDVVMHAWDLGRSAGLDVELDPDLCAEFLQLGAEMEEMMRASGQFGPRVDVSRGRRRPGRLVGFIGRDPEWTPPDA